MSIEAQAGIVDLLYGVTHDQGVAYQPGAVYEGSVAAFICEMRDGEARFTSAGPLESVEAAIDLLEPELRAWELSAELSTGRCALTFVYHNGSMRAPVTAGVTLMAGTARLAFETYRPLLTQTFAAYPAPPNASLRVDATVEILAFHLRKMREPDSFFSAHAYAICIVRAACSSKQRASCRGCAEPRSRLHRAPPDTCNGARRPDRATQGGWRHAKACDDCARARRNL